jgi:hypothetical protein
MTADDLAKLHVVGGHRSCEQFGMEPIVPSLHHRKEGWLRHQKISRSHQTRRSRGGFPFCFHSENHPGLAISGCFAMFFESLGHPSLR